MGDDSGSGLETQALVSQRVALELDERLRQFQQAGQLPSAHTCDLIIVDRCAAGVSWLDCSLDCVYARAEEDGLGKQKDTCLRSLICAPCCTPSCVKLEEGICQIVLTASLI